MSDQEIQNLAVKTIREEFSRRNIGVNRIVLFGSRAKGESRPDSDWDFLVVTENPLSRANRFDAQNAVISRCAKSMIDVELIVRDKQSVEAHSGTAGAIVNAALRDGVSCD